MNNKIKLLIGVVAFIGIIAIASFAYNSLSKEYKPDEETKITQDTTEEKQKAPNFTVLDKDGNSVKLSDFAGKPIVINFWASWCGPCKAEMPYFDEAYKNSKDDVVFLMINLTDNKRETVGIASKFIENQGYSFPIYFDTEQDAAYKYNVYSIPSTLFIDKDGYIVSAHSGLISEKKLLDTIEKIK